MVWSYSTTFIGDDTPVIPNVLVDVIHSVPFFSFFLYIFLIFWCNELIRFGVATCVGHVLTRLGKFRCLFCIGSSKNKNVSKLKRLCLFCREDSENDVYFVSKTQEMMFIFVTRTYCEGIIIFFTWWKYGFGNYLVGFKTVSNIWYNTFIELWWPSSSPTNPSLSIFSFLLIISSRELSRTTSSFLFYERRRKKKLGLSKFPSRLRNPEAARPERDRIMEKAKGVREGEGGGGEGGSEEGLPMPSYQQGKSWRHTSSSLSFYLGNVSFGFALVTGFEHVDSGPRVQIVLLLYRNLKLFRDLSWVSFVCLVFERFIRVFCRFSL